MLETADCAEKMAVLEPGKADLAVVDPPYGIDVANQKWDSTKLDHMEMAKAWLKPCVRALRPGGALLLYGSPCKVTLSRLLLYLVDELGMALVQKCAWVYTQGGDARLSTMREYAVRHEELVWFEKPCASTTVAEGRTFNAAEAVEHYTDDDRAVALAKGKGRVTEASLAKGRPPRSFIDIPRENSRSKERQHGSHPCMKPLALCERLIKVHSNPGDTVLVPFAGSGSEAIAAAKLGRRCIAYEIDAAYAAIATARLRAHGLSSAFALEDRVQWKRQKVEDDESASG